MIIEAWNGVRWKPCRESELPFSIFEGLLMRLAFSVGDNQFRVWLTEESKRDWHKFMSETYVVPLPEVERYHEWKMFDRIGDPSCGEY